MAKIRFEGILTTAQFPLMQSLQGRTVINPIYDPKVRSNRRDNLQGDEDNAGRKLPQISYMENVLPVSEGAQSVGYETVVAALPLATDFDQVIVLRDENENNYLLSPSNGKNYVLDPTSLIWSSIDPILGLTVDNYVTRAYVNGRTFFCYSGVGIYEFDYSVPSIAAVPLTLPTIDGVPLLPSDIRGIGASSNYLLIFTDLTVLWSSLIDPTDFEPSVTTGAGYATPQDVRGKIVCIASTSNGFAIFTYTNAVAAQYTNNVRAPFAFKEISNAGGVANSERVTNQQIAGPIYAWTNSGLQKITLQGAEFVSAEVNDFIAGRLYDYWDETTDTVKVASYGGPEFPTKLALIANRWLTLSYKVGDDSAPYAYALVYDLALKRWGKLKGEHVDCFNFGLPSIRSPLTYNDLAPQSYTDLGATSYRSLVIDTGGTELTSKQQLGFLLSNGTVMKAVMEYYKDATHQAVLILGKHQVVRASTVQHQLTTFEGRYGNFSAQIAVSYDGKNMEAGADMTAVQTIGDTITYGKRISGVNFNLIAKGTFALTSYSCEVTNEGDS